MHNPVLLPEDIKLFSELVRKRGLSEDGKPDDLCAYRWPNNTLS
jgi:hypothetical protein